MRGILFCAILAIVFVTLGCNRTDNDKKEMSSEGNYEGDSMNEMTTFADVESFRRSEDAESFADDWLLAQKSGDVASDSHMNLLAWASDNPFHVLGVCLNLIDRTQNDAETNEQVMLGVSHWLVEQAPDNFVPILKQAIKKHPGFAGHMRYKIATSDEKAWKRLKGK